MTKVSVQELQWGEERLGEIDLPARKLHLSAGFGSGLTAVPDSGGKLVWAIGDRGPNIKLKDAEELYGWFPPPQWRFKPGVKLMPRPDIGPALALLEVGEDSVTLTRTVRLEDGSGKPVSGLPIPNSGHAECEPTLDLDGRHLQPDPNGMDTEGVALLADGSFWIGDEYGPSLVHVSAEGEVIERLVPQGTELPDAGFAVRDALPAIAAKRHLNRGFEAVTVTPSNRHLFIVFQSPLAHPDQDEHEKARHARIWQLDLSGNVAAQYLYRLDEPGSFRRDAEKGEMGPSDIKVCEIAALDEELMLVLERGSETTKIYRVRIDPARTLGPEHLDEATRPTVEQLSCAGEDLPVLDKTLLFTSDEWREIGPDMEGLALLDERTVLIVSDNDFGCEDKKTRFFRLKFDEPLTTASAE